MKTHFVPKGERNTLCGFGFRPWRFDWFPAAGAEARAVTCKKCRTAVHKLGFDVSGVVQVGRPEFWNKKEMRLFSKDTTTEWT